MGEPAGLVGIVGVVAPPVSRCSCRCPLQHHGHCRSILSTGAASWRMVICAPQWSHCPRQMVMALESIMAAGSFTPYPYPTLYPYHYVGPGRTLQYVVARMQGELWRPTRQAPTRHRRHSRAAGWRLHHGGSEPTALARTRTNGGRPGPPGFHLRNFSRVRARAASSARQLRHRQMDPESARRRPQREHRPSACLRRPHRCCRLAGDFAPGSGCITSDMTPWYGYGYGYG